MLKYNIIIAFHILRRINLCRIHQMVEGGCPQNVPHGHFSSTILSNPRFDPVLGVHFHYVSLVLLFFSHQYVLHSFIRLSICVWPLMSIIFFKF
jgi:hypothetical protein